MLCSERVLRAQSKWKHILNAGKADASPLLHALEEQRRLAVAKETDFLITVCGDLSRGAKRLSQHQHVLSTPCPDLLYSYTEIS